MTQSAQLISRTASWPRIKTCNIIALSDAHLGYATARNILRNPDLHILDAIDAAFEVLSSSPSAGDRAPCRKVADQLYEAQPRAAAAPRAPMVIVWAALAVIGACVTGLWVSDAIAGAAFDAVNAQRLAESH